MFTEKTEQNIGKVEFDEGRLEKFAPPQGKTITTEEGSAKSINLTSVVSTASHIFRFQLNNGNITEQTVAVNMPTGSGFIVMLQDLYYAFINRNNQQQLTERPLGQFIADVGMRGNNLVCRVRLTDINADDPVRIEVGAGVLFFN